jgi:hypothetical protein
MEYINLFVCAFMWNLNYIFENSYIFPKKNNLLFNFLWQKIFKIVIFQFFWSITYSRFFWYFAILRSPFFFRKPDSLTRAYKFCAGKVGFGDRRCHQLCDHARAESANCWRCFEGLDVSPLFPGQSGGAARVRLVRLQLPSQWLLFDLSTGGKLTHKIIRL